MKTKAKSKKKQKGSEPVEPINRPTQVREWWLVDVTETRTLKVRATSPKHARSIAAQVMADTYPQTSYMGEPDVVHSFAHAVKCEEGRSMRDRR